MRKNNFVAIIGRPNVGKSCLFNRMLGRRQSIVEETRGVTRDRNYEKIQWNNKEFLIIDTGGIDFDSREKLSRLVLSQAKKAIAESDLIIFVADITTGLLKDDLEIMDVLRKTGKKIILVLNKADNAQQPENFGEFYSLGIENVYAVSALHGINVDLLLDKITELLPEKLEINAADNAQPLKIAVIGRPNAGKSSFINKVLNEERVIVDNKPGTTRDSIDTHITINGRQIILIDTAGIRRKKKSQTPLDVYSSSRTVSSIRRCDACLVILDALEGITRDDLRIMQLVKEAQKCCVLVINKSDLTDLNLENCQAIIEQKAFFIAYAFLVICSAKTGKNINQALSLAFQARDNSFKKIKQKKTNDILHKVLKDTPQLKCAGRLKYNYLSQIKVNPVTFVLIVNNPPLLKNSLLRYIENGIRRYYNFKGAPIKIIVKKKER